MHSRGNEWEKLEKVYIDLCKLRSLLHFMRSHYSVQESHTVVEMYGFQDVLDKTEILIDDVDLLLMDSTDWPEEESYEFWNDNDAMETVFQKEQEE